MPIEKQFKYEDEADFTSHFIVPLLRRLGFSIVMEYHGRQEFGKDLVFGEVDRFGQVAYHGLQAKYVDSISQSDSSGLIDDCREAFNNPFRHPATGAEERICTFCVANGGSMSQNARTNFFNTLSTPFGGQIRMLDGKALLELDRWAAVRQAEAAGEYLSGLLLEVRYNADLLNKIRPFIETYLGDQNNPVPMERLRLGATTHYLTRPFMSGLIDTNVVSGYWHLVGNVINPSLNVIGGTGPLENKRHIAEDFLSHSDTGVMLGEQIALAVEIVLNRLGPIAGV